VPGGAGHPVDCSIFHSSGRAFCPELYRGAGWDFYLQHQDSLPKTRAAQKSDLVPSTCLVKQIEHHATALNKVQALSFARILRILDT
jgi:hypothetical protein